MEHIGLPDINTNSSGLPEINTEQNEKGEPYLSDQEETVQPASLPVEAPEVSLPVENPTMAQGDVVGLPQVAASLPTEAVVEESTNADGAVESQEVKHSVPAELPEELEEEKQPEEELEALGLTEATEKVKEDSPPESSIGKRKLEEEENSRKKQKVAEKVAGEVLQLSLSLDEVQSLMDLKDAAVNANRSFYTIDALLFACKKAMETQPDFNETTGLRIELQLLPTHLTYQQLVQFRAQLLCHRLLARNMQPPDRVLHTARGGYNKKEVEYAEFRRNLLPNIPETVLEMNEYDKQSRIELANRRAKFWTDLQASGY